MAMIFDLELPRDELDKIAAFMRDEMEGDIPELGELGTKILERLTTVNKGLWHVAVGNFVEFQRIEYPAPADIEPAYDYLTPDGRVAKNADHLYDNDDKQTGRWGVVETNYENPSGAFEIGVPF